MIDVNKYTQRVKSFGKFEGCRPIVPYLYDCLMDGDGEEIGKDDAGYSVVKFELTCEEIESFDMGDITSVYLAEDSQGFVFERMPDVTA